VILPRNVRGCILNETCVPQSCATHRGRRFFESTWEAENRRTRINPAIASSCHDGDIVTPLEVWNPGDKQGYLAVVVWTLCNGMASGNRSIGSRSPRPSRSATV
jgi:hypothetical protein